MGGESGRSRASVIAISGFREEQDQRGDVAIVSVLVEEVGGEEHREVPRFVSSRDRRSWRGHIVFGIIVPDMKREVVKRPRPKSHIYTLQETFAFVSPL